MVAMLIASPRWLNMAPTEEARLESRVTTAGISVVLLQRDPNHVRRWLPVASWGRCLEATESGESGVMLELKAMREGAWKLQAYTAFHRNLTFVVSPDLRALLKVAHKAHPTLHAYLIDL